MCSSKIISIQQSHTVVMISRHFFNQSKFYTGVMTETKQSLFCFFQTFSQTNITKVCPGAQCLFAFYGGESVYHHYILVLHLCNLFVVLWLVNFIFALGQCTLAGAFASYYWALKKPKDIPPCPLYSSFSRAIRWGSDLWIQHSGGCFHGHLENEEDYVLV